MCANVFILDVVSVVTYKLLQTSTFTMSCVEDFVAFFCTHFCFNVRMSKCREYDELEEYFTFYTDDVKQQEKMVVNVNSSNLFCISVTSKAKTKPTAQPFFRSFSTLFALFRMENSEMFHSHQNVMLTEK